MNKFTKNLLLLFILILYSFQLKAQNQYTSLVKDILTTKNYRQRVIRIDSLKSNEDEVIKVLASYLNDSELSHRAYVALLQLNYMKASSYIFDVQQNNFQRMDLAFYYYNGKILKGDTFSLDVKEKMLETAIYYLKKKKTPKLADEAIQMIGLCGSDKHLLFLEQIYQNYQDYAHKSDYWIRKIKNSCEASMARLGKETYLIQIENELKITIPKTFGVEELNILQGRIWKAGFAHHQRFLPYLCKISKSTSKFNPPSFHSDIVYYDFKDEAVKAIYQILDIQYTIDTKPQKIESYCN